MEKINLLYIITKLELGGAQKQLLSLLRAIDKEKYSTFLFTARKGILAGEASSINKLTFYKSRFLERPISPFKDLMALIEMYVFIKKNKIHIVHTHSSKAGILGRLAAGLSGMPVIIHTVHGWSFHDFQSGIIKSLYLFLERFCAGFTDKIIAVSGFDRDKGLKNYIGRQEQYIIIRYGIDRDDFKPCRHTGQITKPLGFNEKDVVVGMVACFKPQKAPLDFVRLAARLAETIPHAKFVMVGDGFLRKKICALIKKLKLEDRIILTGWRNDIPSLLSALNVFVLTSLWEGLPIAVLEAQAAGIPVVVTDSGGVREIVKDGQTGYLVKTRDIPAMANRVEKILKDFDLREKFITSSMGIMASGEFSVNNMVCNTEGLYSDLLKGDRKCQSIG